MVCVEEAKSKLYRHNHHDYKYVNWTDTFGPLIKDACKNHPLPAKPLSRLLDMILEYLRKTLLESSKMFVEHALNVAGIQFRTQAY